MFEAVRTEGVTIGHRLDHGDLTFFFGTAEGTRARLGAAFPKINFAFLTQVHGREVVAADLNSAARADAHFSDRPNLAPVIVTADCVPVLLASATRACGVHAGWRGVEADVIGAALATFTADDPVLYAAIGPHLGFGSFEVGRDVAARLGAVAPGTLGDLTRPHDDPAKVYFDLTRLARAQITERAPRATLFEFTPDTLTTPSYHSYRRAPGVAGRNLSFTVRNA